MTVSPAEDVYPENMNDFQNSSFISASMEKSGNCRHIFSRNAFPSSVSSKSCIVFSSGSVSFCISVLLSFCVSVCMTVVFSGSVLFSGSFGLSEHPISVPEISVMQTAHMQINRPLFFGEAVNSCKDNSLLTGST